MTSFCKSVGDAKCNELQTTVKTSVAGSSRFLCYTRLEKETYIITATNGFDLWRVELSKEDIEGHSLDDNISSVLVKIREAFKQQHVVLTELGKRVKLSIGKESQQPIELDLFEVTAALRKTELQMILFRMADNVCALETSVEEADQTIAKIRQQQGTSRDSGVTGMVDYGVDGKRSKGLQKPTSKQPGMSIVNPGCRKRKTAKGVEFE